MADITLTESANGITLIEVPGLQGPPGESVTQTVTATSGTVTVSNHTDVLVLAPTGGVLTGALTLTAPAATAFPTSKHVMVTDPKGVVGTYTVSIARAGSDTINGATANVVMLNTAYQNGWVLSDGVSKLAVSSSVSASNVVHTTGTETIAGAKTFSTLPTLPSQSANLVFAGGAAGAGVPAFRSLVAADLANDLVTYAKIQNVSATDKVLGRSTSGAGDIEEITCTPFGRSLIDDADAATALATLGAVPANSVVVRTSGGVATAYSTLSAAISAAASGDTVMIFDGGTYTAPSTGIAKNGVNIDASKATITSATAIINDGSTGANGAVVADIRVKALSTTNTVSGDNDNATVLVKNASSRIVISCDQIAASDTAGSSPIISAVRHRLGELHVFARDITSSYNGYWWDDGPSFLTCDTLTTPSNATLYATPVTTASGYLWVNAHQIKTTSSSGDAIQITNTTDARVWISAKEISGAARAINMAGTTKAYIVADKVECTANSSTLLQINQGTLWLTAQKLNVTGTSSIFSPVGFLGGATTYITAQQVEFTGNPTTLFDVSRGTHSWELGSVVGGSSGTTGFSVGGGTLNLSSTIIDTSASSTSKALSVTGGTLNLRSCSVTSGASGSDVFQSSGTANVINGRGTNADGTFVTSGTVNFVSTNARKDAMLSDLGVQSLSGAGAVNVTTLATALTTTGGSQALTLADGTAGQIKTVCHVVDGGSGVLTPTTKAGYSTITFTNAGDSVTLQFHTTAGWCVIGSFGVTIA